MNDFRKIMIDEFDKHYQLTKIADELSELSQMICKVISSNDYGENLENVIEKIKKVKIMLNQVELIFKAANTNFSEVFEILAEKMEEIQYDREIKSIDVDSMPKERRGKWLICSDGYSPYCSECGCEPKSGEMTMYCPYCGSKMEEVKIK